MTALFLVTPAGIDDPARPSGGNLYDRRVAEELVALGWSVAERPAPGGWPRPDEAACAMLAATIAELPDGAVVLVDGLIASAAARVLVPHADRLGLVVLVHAPLGLASAGPQHDDTWRATGLRREEGAVLGAAAAVIVTSGWTRRVLLDTYPLRPEAVHIAEPGVDPADRAAGSALGGELLCVAAVAPHKGQDVLVAALGQAADLEWRCVCAGALDLDTGFVDAVRRRARADGVDDRITFTGPLTGAALADAYGAADVLVVPSRAETYGMVVTEALARGVPVIAARVGGLPHALGYGSGGERPGVLVPPGDVQALAAGLRGWLADPGLRERLRAAAAERRAQLTGWALTSERIARVLSRVAA